MLIPQYMRVTHALDEPRIFWLWEKLKDPQIEHHTGIMMAQVLGSGISGVYQLISMSFYALYCSYMLFIIMQSDNRFDLAFSNNAACNITDKMWCVQAKWVRPSKYCLYIRYSQKSWWFLLFLTVCTFLYSCLSLLNQLTNLSVGFSLN